MGWQKAELADRVGDKFEVSAGDTTFDWELTECSEIAGGGFSVLFLGPPEPVLAQGIYRITHASLEGADVFFVPLGVSEKGVEYEAVFS